MLGVLALPQERPKEGKNSSSILQYLLYTCRTCSVLHSEHAQDISATHTTTDDRMNQQIRLKRYDETGEIPQNIRETWESFRWSQSADLPTRSLCLMRLPRDDKIETIQHPKQTRSTMDSLEEPQYLGIFDCVSSNEQYSSCGTIQQLTVRNVARSNVTMTVDDLLWLRSLCSNQEKQYLITPQCLHMLHNLSKRLAHSFVLEETTLHTSLPILEQTIFNLFSEIIEKLLHPETIQMVQWSLNKLAANKEQNETVFLQIYFSLYSTSILSQPFILDACPIVCSNQNVHDSMNGQSKGKKRNTSRRNVESVEAGTNERNNAVRAACVPSSTAIRGFRSPGFSISGRRSSAGSIDNPIDPLASNGATPEQTRLSTISSPLLPEEPSNASAHTTASPSQIDDFQSLRPINRLLMTYWEPDSVARRAFAVQVFSYAAISAVLSIWVLLIMCIPMDPVGRTALNTGRNQINLKMSDNQDGVILCLIKLFLLWFLISRLSFPFNDKNSNSSNRKKEKHIEPIFVITVSVILCSIWYQLTSSTAPLGELLWPAQFTEYPALQYNTQYRTRWLISAVTAVSIIFIHKASNLLCSDQRAMLSSVIHSTVETSAKPSLYRFARFGLISLICLGLFILITWISSDILFVRQGHLFMTPLQILLYTAAVWSSICYFGARAVVSKTISQNMTHSLSQQLVSKKTKPSG